MGEHDEVPLRRVLRWPHNREPGLRRLPLAPVGLSTANRTAAPPTPVPARKMPRLS
jgi:hypothetical protein